MTLFCIAMLLAGVLFIGVGKWIPREQERKKRIGTLCVDGVVADIQKERKSGGGYSYYPVYRYVLNGCTYQKTSRFGADAPPFSPGQTVEVRVNPENAEDWFVPSEGTGDYMADGFCRIGWLFLGIGAVTGLLLIVLSAA